MLDALPRLVAEGLRLAVGDGGTQAGIMEWAGLVRRRSGGAFPLLGVAPAEEITTTGEPGRTAIDPNHTHVVAGGVTRSGSGAGRADRPRGGGHWGAETDAMYQIFGRLAAGRASVTLVVNGGAITLDEVGRNIAQRRPMVVVAGSGRAADAVVARVRGVDPAEPGRGSSGTPSPGSVSTPTATSFTSSTCGRAPRGWPSGCRRCFGARPDGKLREAHA